jgi:hypothetical protein
MMDESGKTVNFRFLKLCLRLETQDHSRGIIYRYGWGGRAATHILRVLD